MDGGVLTDSVAQFVMSVMYCSWVSWWSDESKAAPWLLVLIHLEGTDIESVAWKGWWKQSLCIVQISVHRDNVWLEEEGWVKTGSDVTWLWLLTQSNACWKLICLFTLADLLCQGDFHAFLKCVQGYPRNFRQSIGPGLRHHHNWLCAAKIACQTPCCKNLVAGHMLDTQLIG